MAGFLNESNGSPSSTRLVFFVVAGVVLGVFCYATATGKPIPAIPESVLVLFGIVMGGKVTQKAFEKDAQQPQGQP